MSLTRRAVLTFRNPWNRSALFASYATTATSTVLKYFGLTHPAGPEPAENVRALCCDRREGDPKRIGGICSSLPTFYGEAA